MESVTFISKCRLVFGRFFGDQRKLMVGDSALRFLLVFPFCCPEFQREDFHSFFLPYHYRLFFRMLKYSFGTLHRRTQRTMQKLCNSVVTVDSVIAWYVQFNVNMWVIQAICVFSTTLLNLKIANYMEIRLRIKWVTSHTVLLQRIISRSL